MNNCRTVF